MRTGMPLSGPAFTRAGALEEGDQQGRDVTAHLNGSYIVNY